MSSLAVSGKSFVSDWHPSRNGSLTPENVTVGSNKEVWWLGKDCGHEWVMTVGYRSRGFNCPVCVSLGVLYPELAEEWHPTKNDKTPFQFRANSGVKVWWLGKECGHEWDADIRGRVRDKYGCPYCVNQRILKGFNDLETTHPEVAAEWHPTKNGVLFPSEVTYGSKQKVWWLGKECGHEWFAGILPRASKNMGCAVCRGLQINLGANDFATTHPHVAKDWHPTKNGSLTAEEVVAGSHREVWWLGKECGHEWQAVIYSRGSGDGCRVCANRKIVRGINDFATTHPHVAKDWHPNLNGQSAPSKYSYGANVKASWICAEGHTWVAKISDRCVKNSNCPQCAATTYISKAEQEIADYVSGLGLNIQTSVRNIIKGELDIYVPEKKVAVEFNGLYWHSEAAGKTKTYHYDKWLACKDKGVQLIQIWEDEWNRNPEQIKSMLSHKLGVSGQRKVSARKTEVVELTNEQTAVFLNANHVQGYTQGGVRLGLVEKSNPDMVLAVMVLKSEPGSNGKVLNLVRFATSQPVVGGFTKLLKHVERTYSPSQIITFSDNCISDGGLYKNNGFVAVKKLEPDYKYVVKGKRVHKFRYRLKKFRGDPTLQYEEGLSERELALLNSIPRIWDAGKVKWVKFL